LNGNKYIGYTGQLSSVLTFVNDDGSISVCASDERAKTTYVYEFSKDLKLAKTMRFENEFVLLGAFTKDTIGNYYFFFTEDAGKNAENMAMVKYSKDGAKQKIYTLKARAENSFDGVKKPFDGGSCRLELSGDLLGVYFARLMFNGHQASYGFVLNKDTFERVDIGAATNDREAGQKIMPYVSHSFNQWIVPVDDGFVFADHGDAYPRGFAFASFQTDDRTKRVKGFTFTGAQGQNATYAQMGGVVKTKDGFLFAGTYGKGAAAARNVFVLRVKSDMSECGEPLYLTAYTKEHGHAAHPKIAALDNDRYLLMWELCEFTTQSANTIVADPTGYKATFMMIVDENGKQLTEAKQMPAGIRLNMNDVLRFNKSTGSVYWAVNAGSKGFALYAFNPYNAMNYTHDDSLFHKAAEGAPEDFKFLVKGKKGESQTITITKYVGKITNLIIPSQINDIPVTVIGKDAFSFSTVSSVKLPDTLKIIEDQAFWYSSITALAIPQGVTHIGRQAFSFCKGLTEVAIPRSMQSIKEFAFMDCPLLTTITVHKEADMQVGYGAFDKCPNLDAVSKAVLSAY
jgi:hypothetical protein